MNTCYPQDTYVLQAKSIHAVTFNAKSVAKLGEVKDAVYTFFIDTV